MDAFLAGLNDQIANRILEIFPGPRSLSAMQTIAARIDSKIAANRIFLIHPINQTIDQKTIIIIIIKRNGTLIKNFQIQNPMVHYLKRKKKMWILRTHSQQLPTQE